MVKVNDSKLPESPFVATFRSSVQEMQNRRKGETGKKRLGLPPVLIIVNRMIGLDRLKNTDQIGIPHPDCILDADLPHQQAIHPAKSKLHEFDIL